MIANRYGIVEGTKHDCKKLVRMGEMTTNSGCMEGGQTYKMLLEVSL